MDEIMSAVGGGLSILGGISKQLRQRQKRDLTNQPPRADHIRSRQKELDSLWSHIRCNENFLLVNGFGGVGKTSLLRKFYHLQRGESCFHRVAWIPYLDTLSKSICLSFLSDTENEEEKVKEFFQALRSEPKKKKLLVLDDVEHPEEDGLLQDLTGIPNLTVILTSRASALQSYHTVPIDVLEEKDCVEIFLDYYGKKDCARETVLDLVRLVQCHTLAVEILAKTALQRREPLEVFLSELQKKGLSHSTLKAETSYRDGSRTMAAYLRELFPMEEREEAEIPVLQNVALMPSMEIPVEVADWISCEQATLEQLVKSGWLEFHEETDDHPAGYYMHPLVKETVLLDREKFPESIGTEFEEYIRPNKYFKENETYVTVFPKLEIADSVLKGMGERETEEYGEACNELAYEYQTFGLYDRAEEYLLKVLAVCEKVLGTEHPDTAGIWNNLALLYKKQGAYDRAEEYYLKALAVCEKVLGAEHPDTAQTYNNLATLYQDQGAYDRAEKYHLKALAVKEKVLGTEHPNMAITYNNLGLLYQDQGAYDWAEEYHLKAIAVKEKALGTEHPDTAITYHNIGCLRYAQGDYDGAMEQFLRAFRVWRKVFGETHPYYKEESNWISKTYPKTSYGKNQPFEIWFASVTKEEIT